MTWFVCDRCQKDLVNTDIVHVLMGTKYKPDDLLRDGELTKGHLGNQITLCNECYDALIKSII